MNWPAYPEYKDSGVEWLGDVPASVGDARAGSSSIAPRYKLRNDVADRCEWFAR